MLKNFREFKIREILAAPKKKKSPSIIVVDDDLTTISGLRNDLNIRTFYKERKINNRSFDFLSKQNIIVPLILDINGY